MMIYYINIEGVIMLNNVSWDIFADYEPPKQKQKKKEKDDIYFGVEFNDIKINISVDDFCKDHNLDSEFIDVLDDISSTAKFGRLFVPSCGGGFLRRWVNGEKFKDTDCDIDFFFLGINSGNEFNSIRQPFKDFIINNYEGKLHSTNPDRNYDMTMVVNNKDQKLQLMSHLFSYYHSDPKHDLNYAIMRSLLRYDNINSMIGYNAANRTLVMHENCVQFNKDKLYIYNFSQHNLSHPLRIFDRFEKFVKEGYGQPENTEYKLKMLKFIESKKSKFDQEDMYV